MKKGILLLLPLFLSSCLGGDPSRVEFTPSKDESKPFAFRNGGLDPLMGYSAPLSTYTRASNAEDMSRRIDGGEAFFLYLSSPSCSFCIQAKDAVCSFLSQTDLEFLLLEGPSRINAELRSLKAAYPELDLPATFVTPSLYQFSGNEVNVLSIQDATSSPRAFGEAVLPHVNVSSVPRYASFDAFKADAPSAYYVTDTGDTGIKTLMECGMFFSDAPFAIVDLYYFDQQEKSEFSSLYPGAGEFVLPSLETPMGIESEGASEILTSYFS